MPEDFADRGDGPDAPREPPGASGRELETPATGSPGEQADETATAPPDPHPAAVDAAGQRPTDPVPEAGPTPATDPTSPTKAVASAGGPGTDEPEASRWLGADRMSGPGAAAVPAVPPMGYGPWGGPPDQPGSLPPWHQEATGLQPVRPNPAWPIPMAGAAGAGAVAGAGGGTAPTPAMPLGPGGPAYPRGPDSAGAGGPAAGPTRPSHAMRTWLAVAVVAALIGGAVGAAVAWAARGNTSGTTSTVTIREGNASPGAAVLSGNVSIPRLVHEVLPAVVSIDVKNQGEEDQGTGMIISSNGEVITNNHVVSLAEGGGTITVTESGTTKAQPATLVGADPSKDAALLQIKAASGLPTITFGDSNKLVVGDGAVAIGNALGLAAGTPTVTQGIVSALGRTVTAGDATSSATETLTDMIQTDAAINPGNSGGPLIDTAGQVIGMNTAVAGTASDGSNAQNIGFAIPSSSLEALLSELQRGGTVNTGGGVLGVDVTTLTSQLQQQYGFTPSQGAVILSVLPGSPADTAGLQEGDVIVAVDSNPVTSADQLQSVLSKTKPGQTVQLTYYVGNLRQTKPVTLESQSEEQQQSQSSSGVGGGSLVPGGGVGGLLPGGSGSTGGGLSPFG